MPELPEVETICKLLREGGPSNPPLVGRTISDVQLLWPRTLEKPAEDEFIRRLPAQIIQNIRRRGKFLIFNLSQDAFLVHLRMSGDLRVEPIDAPVLPHDRLIIFLASLGSLPGVRIAFNDTRKFGRVWLVRDPLEVVGEIGPEPLDESFTSQDLYQKLLKSRRQLKPLLLDQTFLAGLGNIYADEALHRSHLHPLMLSNQVSEQQALRLWEGIRQALQDGIHHNGASIDWVYRGGDFQNYFRVYQRTGQPCPVCGTPIERIVVGQRGTHFCPKCQGG